MLMSDYRAAYPGKIVQISTLTKEQQLEKNKRQSEWFKDKNNRKAYDEKRSSPNQIKHWIRKGLSEEEAKQKVSEFQKKIALKQNNPKTKAKISKRVSGDANPSSVVSVMKRYNVDEVTARTLMPCSGRNGEKHPFYGKKHTEEAIRKIGHHLNHSGRSIIEHELSDKLIELWGGEKNAPAGGFCCDYVNREKNFIVEFFGDFWHHNPKFYDAEHINKLTKRVSKDVWNRDTEKLNILREKGFYVEVIWEFDWRTNKEACLKKVKDAYDRIL